MLSNQPLLLEFVKEHATIVHVQRALFGTLYYASFTLDEPLIWEENEYWSGTLSTFLTGILLPDDSLDFVPRDVSLLETRDFEVLGHEIPRHSILFLNAVVSLTLELIFLICLFDKNIPDHRFEQCLRKIYEFLGKALASTASRMKRLSKL
jgi:hypothetical protein